MPRMATVYDIFIASPSDVTAEREIAVNVIHKWNDLHSLARAIMLRPVRYEKNSRPTTKYEGQEAVNRQCLDFSDLVVGIFGNRLGTPTSKAESGTAEEIDRHVAAGKEAIIFFSEKPVSRHLTAEEKEQLEKLNAYHDAWRSKANIGYFKSENEFETEFDKSLTLYMNSLPVQSPTTLTSLQAPTANELAAQLSPEAQKLLIALSNDEQGIVVKSVVRAWTKLVCHNLDIPQKTPRDQAKAGEALKQLITLKLVDEFGNKGTAWKITERGFDVADVLQKPEIVVVHPPKSEFMKNFEKGFGPTR